METERAANKYKQVEYMQSFIGDEFEAVISGVATFGFWAETVEHKCEGMVSVADLHDIDDFVFREGEYALVGYRTGMRFAMGDKVKVRVVAANLAKRQIDYSITELPDLPSGKKKLLQAGQSGKTMGTPRPPKGGHSSRPASSKHKKR
jgi:ribonuclease R